MNNSELPVIRLVHLPQCDPEIFYQIATDPDVVYFFDQFKELSKDGVLNRLKGINSDLAYSQYWGIHSDDQTLIGFVALKRSDSVFRALEHEKMKHPDYIPDIDALDAAMAKPKTTAAREKALSPYTVDIALLKTYRGKGYAKAAFKAVVGYALMAGINELFFEVRPDNANSLKLMSAFGCELVIPAEIQIWPAIYRFAVTLPEGLAQNKMLERLRELQNTQEINGYNDWRAIIKQIPELVPHEKLLTDLFTAVHAEGSRIEFDKKRNDCHFDSDGYEKILTIGTAKRNAPLSIIWSIAHEYGHACQKYATANEKVLFSQAKYEREADAWNRGEQWLRNTIYYRHNWPSFINLRHQRLHKYLP